LYKDELVWTVVDITSRAAARYILGK